MEYTNVTDPKWANAEHTVITCTVDFAVYGATPFAANSQDTANPSSKEIFDRCIAGDFGSIASYSPPAPYVPSEQANKTEAERRLAATDWVNQPDVIDISRNPHLLNQSAFLDYRSSIRIIAVTPPEGNLNWPIEPIPQWS
jgi:hypothetical protein